jgi:hypothetical protein
MTPAYIAWRTLYDNPIPTGLLGLFCLKIPVLSSGGYVYKNV